MDVGHAFKINKTINFKLKKKILHYGTYEFCSNAQER